MSNNYDGPYIITNGVGSAAAPAAGYFGFGRTAIGTQSTGPRIMAGTGTPNGVTTAPLGSLWLRSDAAGFFRNTDGATAWSAV